MFRNVYRVVSQPAFSVVRRLRSATTSTEFYRNHFHRNVIQSSCIPKQERRLLSQKAQTQTDELVVDFNYVNTATTNPKVLIIDVREPEEVKEHGRIPNSINIPLANIVPTLTNVSEKEFIRMFEKDKPKEETELIFYCMIGKRSEKAQKNALNLGYKNSKNYLGSWTDWATKTNTN